MTIRECLDVCWDRALCKVKIIMLHKYPDETHREVLYFGPGDEVPDHLDNMEFDSYDVPKKGTMTFNLHMAHPLAKEEEREKCRERGCSFFRPGKPIS